MWLLALLTTLAGADEPAYRACCTELEGGLCPTFLEVVGPSSARTDDGIRGVWALTCQDGTAYFPAAQRQAAAGSEPGTVLTQMSDVAAACFAAACDLPVRLCLIRSGSLARVVDCETQREAQRSAWEDTRLSRPTVVVAGQRVLRTSTVPPDRERIEPVQMVRAQPPPAPADSPVSDAPPSPPPPASAADPYATTPVAAQDQGEAQPEELDLSLPEPPPEPCVVQAHLRQPSIDQVELGDEMLVVRRIAKALGHYRAAITINRCNPFAWAQLGTALLDQGGVDTAVAALEYATRLMPHHFRAWTELGRARERQGEHVAAIEAYQEALTLRPGYVPAEAGLRRSIRNR